MLFPTSPRRRRLSGALALLLLVAGTAQAQDISINVTAPAEGDLVLFQPLGPDKAGGPERARISMRMTLANNGPTPLAVTRIDILGQTASNFLEPRVIAPGKSLSFQNCNCNYPKQDPGDPDELEIPRSYPVIVDAPYPVAATIAVYLQGYRTPVTKTVRIAPHSNDGGPLRYAAKASDLRLNEAWSTSSNHPGGSQVFGLDTHVRGWDGKDWSELRPGSKRDRPEHTRAYGMPVYAMADGTVCSALNDLPEWKNFPRDSSEPVPVSPSTHNYSSGGNFVTVRTGDEVALYAHLQPGSIPAELLQPGAKVRQGQYLGKVGYSGATSGPHLHVHVTRETSPGSCKGNASHPVPMTFGQLQSLTYAEAKALASKHDMDPLDWTALDDHSAPHKFSLLYPEFKPYPFVDEGKDQRRFIGVWQDSNAIELRVNVPGWQAFTQKWDELSKDGFRLEEVNTYAENGTRHFMGLFKRGTGKHALLALDSWPLFASKRAELAGAGVHLVDIATYSANGKTHYIGAFREGNGWSRVEKTASLSELVLASNAYSNLFGLELVDIEFLQPAAPYSSGKGEFIGVYRSSNDKTLRVTAASYAEFADKWREQHKLGMRLVDVETYREGDQRHYMGLFRPGKGSSALELVTGYQKLFQSAEKHAQQGRRLVDVHVLP